MGRHIDIVVIVLVTQISHEFTLDMAKCIEFQENVLYKTATFSLHHMTKCVELQEISYKPAKFSPPTRSVNSVCREHCLCP
jgi:hypothetical protein